MIRPLARPKLLEFQTVPILDWKTILSSKMTGAIFVSVALNFKCS